MQDPINAHFHVGIIHPMAFPEVMTGEGPIPETLRQLCQDEFFSAIEVSWIKDPKVRAEAKAILTQSGVEVLFVGQLPLLQQKLNLNAREEAARQQAVAQCCQLVDQAYELGASIMGVVSGPDPGEAERPRATELLIDSLKQICRYAQEKAETQMLAISLESFDRTVDKKALIGPTVEAIAVAEAVKAEYSNFGLTLDLSHQPLLGEKVTEMVTGAIDHLISLHIGNCLLSDPDSPVYGDQHPRFGLPGSINGVEQVRLFLEAAYYAGYFKKNCPTVMPVISFEVKPQPGEESALIIANAKRTLLEAWAKL
jgi:sugar phosphate isomerase/epimerase